VVVTVTDAKTETVTTSTFTGPQAIDADADVVDASGTTILLIAFGGQGDDVITGGTNTNIIFGDRGEVLYHPIAPVSDVADGIIDLTHELFAGDADTVADVVTVEIDGTPVTAEGFTIDPATNTVTILDTVALAGATSVVVTTTDAQGNVSVEAFVGPQGIGITPDANNGTVGLHIDIVDIAPDTVVVELDSDVLSEDNYLVDAARNQVVISSDVNLSAVTDITITVTPDGGQAVPETVTPDGTDNVAQLVTDVFGGQTDSDTITTPEGQTQTIDGVDDLLIGGATGDTINAGEGDNIVAGDSARILFEQGLVMNVITLAPSVGGADQITTGDSDDIFIGGATGDSINAGDGRDIGLGDNGQILFDLVDGDSVLQLIE
jgi:hypothetical protein